ncbi:MAG: twin-arginine translocase TatA/TatE family subunit [Cyanobacteria bacterium REEB65]|nr:twin-arginine translocase TatA/TatE family subunit [Cyanobacteria bacterium REEB65]
MLTPTTAILVGAVALIIFGPKQLPELAKSLGKAMGEFKKGLNGEPEAPPPASSASVPAAPAVTLASPPAAAPTESGQAEAKSQP